jgi:hypothetical protein
MGVARADTGATSAFFRKGPFLLRLVLAWTVSVCIQNGEGGPSNRVNSRKVYPDDQSPGIAPAPSRAALQSKLIGCGGMQDRDARRRRR